MLFLCCCFLQGAGLTWLFPFVDGQPPIGWHDAGAYLVLPVLLVASQFISQKIVSPQSTDPQQQQTQAILGFIPFMIGEAGGLLRLCCYYMLWACALSPLAWSLVSAAAVAALSGGMTKGSSLQHGVQTWSLCHAERSHVERSQAAICTDAVSSGCRQITGRPAAS